MGNNLTKVLKKIASNELVIGTSVALAEPIVSEVLCNCGFDFIWIEGEHSIIDKRDIDLHIMIISKSGVAPFVRIAWNDPVIAKPVLDMGPAAIIFPFIKTAEEARLAVRSCKYPPKGMRGFGPIRADNFSTMDGEEYLELSKREPWVIIQIEHMEAVKNLKEILSVEGVDSIVVGPNDLSGSMGLLGKTRHPEVIKALDKIAEQCNNAKVPFGASIGFNPENISDWLERGVSWFALNDDITYLINGGKACIRETLELNNKIKKSKK